MPNSVLYMAMSLDRYIAGPNDMRTTAAATRFMRLHEWFVTPDGEFSVTGPVGELYDDIGDGYGAVLTGRRTVEQVHHWGGDHHGRPSSYQVIGRLVHRSPTTTWSRMCSTASRVLWHRRRLPRGTATSLYMGHTPRNEHVKQGCSMSCRSVCIRRYSGRAVGYSSYCRQASNWRSQG